METFPWRSKHLVLSVGPSLPYAMSRRRTGGLCGCLQGKDVPPEITYQVVENGGVVSLQPVVLTPTQPMPDEEELNAKFAELVDELDLTAAKKEVMYSLSAQKKWQLYLSKKLEMEETSSHVPDYYIDRVNSMANLMCPRDDKEMTSRAELLDNLKTALRTQPNSFVLRFLEKEGLSSLLHFLGRMEYETSESPVHTSAIGCIKALMNNSGGRAHVLAHPTAMATVAQSLSCGCVKTKVAVLEILGAVCLVPGGHKKVLAAVLHFQKHAAERTRFQTIVNDLDRSTGVYRDDLGLKTAIMSFVNAVLNYGPGEDHLEFRLHLRYEFLMLGIQPTIDKLRGHENATLDRHLDIFEMVRNEDEKELARRFDMVHVETKSASAMFDLLRRKLSHTAAYPHFLSMLQHALTLPLDYGASPQHWLLFDRLVQQIVLQGQNGKDPDLTALEINVKDIVQLLATEEELREARERSAILEKEYSELSSKVAKRERDLEQATQEKEDLSSQLNKLKSRLEKESVAHLEAQQKVAELEYRVAESQRMLEAERLQRSQAESLAKAASLCDDAKVGLGVSSTPPGVGGRPPQMPPPPPPPPHQGSNAAPPPPPPPPMILTNGMCPPPPPAPAVSNRINKKKSVPQPSNPLKSFNWSKLPESKVDGTVWLELDDSKLYKDIDLYDFDRTFSAYQKQQVLAGSSEDIPAALQGTQTANVQTPGQGGRGSSANLNGSRARELSVIDGRRAQNCTILLSKLRMANEDICTAILTMDAKDRLPKDMVEQLLKFMPSAEEIATLEEHSTEIDSMARADRFLYEISRIVHYEQRLRTLFYKKKFQERVADCKPKIEAVLEASKEVQRSKRLKKLLEVILALGNYMNRGQRGNALGFHLSSLNRIADTKSSVSRNLTLLHFLVDTLDKKFKDTLKLEEDIAHVRQASKVNLTELKKEMKFLKSGIEEIQRELEFYRSCPADPRDKYSPVMKDFLAHAMFKFSDLQENFQDMTGWYEKCLCHFGEDASGQHQQPDEFFGIFEAFLTSFNEARQESEALRKKKEADEDRRKIRHNRILDAAQQAQDSLDHPKREKGLSNGLNGSNGSLNGLRTIGGSNGSVAGKGEFDDLICALRTGDVFSEDLAKFRRNRRRNHHGSGSSSTLPAGEGWTSRAAGVRETSRERVNTGKGPLPQANWLIAG